jgi:predicted negative regulator of RcsB-dependent stress response
MSKKHPGAGRVHRERHDEDIFVESVLEGSVWAREHGRRLMIVGIAALALLIGFILYRNYRADLGENAASELNRVRQTVLSGNKQLAISDLTKFVAMYGKTPAGVEARTMLAQMHLSMNQPQQAVTAIQPVADDVEESPAAAFLLAGAYEALKQPEKAEEAYLKIADEAKFGFEKREALERAAGVRVERGNTAGAIELYNRALETLPEDSPDRTIYEMRIAELRGGSPVTS